MTLTEERVRELIASESSRVQSALKSWLISILMSLLVGIGTVAWTGSRVATLLGEAKIAVDELKTVLAVTNERGVRNEARLNAIERRIP